MIIHCMKKVLKKLTNNVLNLIPMEIKYFKQGFYMK